MDLASLFDTSPFPPRWHCGEWSDRLGWIHIGSDLATFAAYTAIPLIILYFLRRRPDLALPRVAWFFVAFIFSCGCVHLIEAIIFWEPVYRLSALFKVLTAAVSLATAIVLVRITPSLLAIPERAALADELERSNRELESFATVASHDLASPIASIRGYLDLVENGPEDRLHPEDREFVARARGSAERMGAMLQSILEFARIGGNGETEATEVDVGALVRELVEARRSAGVEFAAEIGPLPTVETAAPLLERVLSNLIGNALKYCSDAPRVEFSSRRHGDGFEFIVRDHGIGIPPSSRERVFELFVRAHPELGAEGLGLGLAECRKIVEFLGGRIWIADDVDGPGTAFHFTLPRRWRSRR
ncbi:MAG: HAMP domain-containing sensor histidine kinase [Planctomycetota bacterium]